MFGRRTTRSVWMAALVAVCWASSALALPYLPAVPKGNIAVNLRAVATGMSAPLYGFQPARRHQPPVRPGAEWAGAHPAERRAAARFCAGLTKPRAAATRPGKRQRRTRTVGTGVPSRFQQPGQPRFSHALHVHQRADSSRQRSDLSGAEQRNAKLQVAHFRVARCRPPTRTSSIRRRRREIISFGKNAGNHNGGTIAFGPDGYLYLAIGRRRQRQRRRTKPHRTGRQCAESDHAAGQDAPHRSAEPDADARQPGCRQRQRPVPHSDNQSVTTARARCRKSYAIGLRNPYRFAFDRMNGELILADVGQNNIEEINRITVRRQLRLGHQGRRMCSSTARPGPSAPRPVIAAPAVQRE